ncbi:MAG: YqgE/AlgH family protein [Acidimicrobiia bacterium]|nr:YqgE/AlgH family protein [Acidimicrobiia bacterium]
MDTLAGRLLVAGANLLDPNFYRTVVLILEHDAGGAVGVVLNRPSTSGPGDELPDWVPLLAEPSVVFVGGPVEPQAAVGLAEGTDGPVLPGVGIVDLSAPPGELRGPVRVYAGYAGWAPGQLELELAADGWIVADALPDDVFAAEPDRLWSTVLRRQPGRTAWLATLPVDPRLN